MSTSLFRTKKIESILAEGGDDTHGDGGLKRVLSMKDLTFFGIAAIYQTNHVFPKSFVWNIG